MATFVGEFEQTLDPVKRRLPICAALREHVDPTEDGENFFLVLGPDRHLWLYPDRYYRRLLDSLKRSPFPTKRARRVGLLFAMARFLKPDAQGRVVLPEKSLARATVAERVTLVGQHDHIEVWPTDEWEAHVAGELDHYEDILEEAGEQRGADSGAV
jgi:MraZ protein